MKITLKELRKLIRESVEQQMQQEGMLDAVRNIRSGAENIAAKLGVGLDPKFIIDKLVEKNPLTLDNNASDYFISKKRKEVDEFLKNPTKQNWFKLNPDSMEAMNDETQLVKDIQIAYPKLSEEEIKGKLQNLELKTAIENEFMNRFVKVAAENLKSRLASVNMKEMVREEIVRQLRSRR